MRQCSTLHRVGRYRQYQVARRQIAGLYQLTGSLSVHPPHLVYRLRYHHTAVSVLVQVSSYGILSTGT
eukprot:376040-Rhodomonas_salina.1